MNAQDERRAKMLEKVRKLLAMGRDGRGNANENETAMRQANKLMAEFGIAEAECDIQAMDAGAMSFGEAAAAPDGSVPGTSKKVHRLFASWAGVLAVGVARFTDTVVTRRTREFGEVVVFQGEKNDVLLARWLFQVLIEACLIEQKKSGWTNGKAERNSFLGSAASALQDRLKTLARERHAMYEAVKSTSMALVVVDRKKDQIVARFGVQKTRSHHFARSSTGAAQAGSKAGQRINIPSGRPLEHQSSKLLS